MNVDDLVRRISDRPPAATRFVVAIAGPPAAGKTTMAAAIRDALPTTTAILALDAFHFDNAVLTARSQLARKGAPFTFDVSGYRRCLETLVQSTDHDVAVPVFDRALELARNSAEIVPPACEVIITEGNYLLLADTEWASLAPLFDLTVFLNADLGVVRQRIIDRWLGHGFTAAEAERRAEENDLPNADTVLSFSRPANITISTT